MPEQTIIELEARRVNYDAIHLMWSILPITNKVKYTISRALNVGEFQKIATTTSTSFLDKDKLLLNSKARYRISTDNISEEIEEDKAGDPFLYEIVSSHEYVMQHAKSGAKVKIYCLCRNNTPCPECYNTKLQKRIKTSCDTCDGSGYVTGFKGPVETYVNLLGAEQKSSDFYGGGPATVRKGIWLSNYPLVNPGDIVIFSPIESYMIKVDPQKTLMIDINNNPYVVRQTAYLEKLDSRHQANNFSIQKQKVTG